MNLNGGNEEEDDDGPASQIMKTESGNVYDMKNLPGAVKQRLIMEGEVALEDFTTPDNMPGAKLKALRDEKRAQYEGSLPADAKTGNPYKIGDVVRFKNIVSEIFEINETSLKIKKANGEMSKWINHVKVKRVELEEDEDNG